MICFFLLLLLLFWRASIIIWKWIPNEKKTHRNNNKNQKIAVRDHTLASLLGRLFRMYIFVCIGKMKKKNDEQYFCEWFFVYSLTEKKVPRPFQEGMPMIADSFHILWIFIQFAFVDEARVKRWLIFQFVRCLCGVSFAFLGSDFIDKNKCTDTLTHITRIWAHSYTVRVEN